MSAAPFQANQRFRQYTLIAPIAVGGMAEVWLAKLDGPQGFQKKVALKRMMGTLSEQPQFVSLFLDEARLMSGLNHPNIAQVFELGEHDESFYVAMEFIDGQTVQHVMRAVTKAQQRLPVELAVKIARDAADALHYAHTKVDENGRPLNVIHRDVSPQNLMVTYEGVAKLLDFGIAKAATRSNATEAGQLRGKLSYMPPEQARGEAIDHRADQFALGVTLFEMLTHTRLYPALKEMDLFRIVATKAEPYETPRERDPSVPEELSAIVARMMDREPTQRYPTMADARDKLTAFLHTISQTMPSNEALSVFMNGMFPPESRRVAATATSSTSLPIVGGELVSSSLPRPVKTRRNLALAAVALLAVVGITWAVWPAETPKEPLKPPVVVAEPPKVPEVVDAGLAMVPPVPDDDVVLLPELDAGVAEVTPTPTPTPQPKTPKKVKAKGKLALVTTPWTIAYLNGKSLGETPLNVPLPAGKHRLVLVNDERKLKTTIEVDIKPNETTTMKLKL